MKNESFNIIYFGFLIGFLFYFIIDRGEGKKALLLGILWFKLNGKKYHMHHWINFSFCFLGTLPFVYFYGFNSAVLGVWGISLGSVVQGLTYSDAFKI